MVKSNKQLTLGQLIKQLEELPATATVMFDFGSLVPVELISYRGYYEDLALTFDRMGWTDGVAAPLQPTVESLLKECRAALGTEFEGYKGGQYRMNSETALWASNYGFASGTMIVGVRPLGDEECYAVVLETTYDPGY